MRNGRPAGSIAATGGLDLEAREAQVVLEAEDFDPEWIVDGWSGRVSGTTMVDAQLDPSARVQFGRVDARGQLRGYPVAATGSATYAAPDGWAFDPLRLVSDGDTVVVSGHLDRASLALDLDADIDQADAWVPRLRGQVAGKVTVTGTWQAPRARGQLSARSIEVANVRVDALDVGGELGVDAEAPWQLELAGTGIEVGSVDADRLQARIGGTTSAHRVQVDVGGSDWQASTAASGGLTAEGWRGTVEALDFDEMLLGRWSLTEPASAAFGAHRINVATSCLVHVSGGRWCAALDLEGSSSDRLVLFAQNFSLETLKPLLPPALTVDGTYQLSASLFDLTGSPHGALALTGGTTRFRVAFGDEQAFATELHDLLVGVTLENGKLELQADVRSDSEGRASVRASVADVGRASSPIEGRVTAAWPDLAFLGLLSPELEQVTGAIDVNLGLGGTLEEPKIDGEADWTGGQIALPAWGVLVEDIDGKITGSDEGVLEFNATGRAGDGQLTLAGTTELDAAAGWHTALTLRGSGVRAVQLPDAEIFADPDLEVEVALPELRVMGTLRVPKASITLDALPEQAVTPSADVVLHGEATSEAYRPLQLRASVDVELGDDVHYTGLNLDTKVMGSLRMATAPNVSASAAGTLTLAGTYNAYGQLLDLERGRLVFNGPLDDPGLDVRAVRTIDTTRVGIELGGTLKSPETRVFSTPAMSEADALSYLLLGRPVTGTGSEETATLQTAAISMGLQQALPVVQRLGASLKLDELTVRPTATDAGALMAGKYLSPKIYIRYSYGLFNRIGGLLLRFKVNERLSIETRSGERKSMDLLYTVEKD
jgi:translocation and assembly module TamB